MTAEKDPPPESAARKPTLRLLQAEIANAPEAPGTSPASPPPAPEDPGPPPHPLGDRASRARGEIFTGCPVIALGVYGETFFYLDIHGQLAPVTNHTKDRMRGIFGHRCELLTAQFPQHNKEGQVSGWSQERTASAMVTAASEKGVWNAFEKVRGLGAWPGDDGGVILHCGDAVLHGNRWLPPGEIDGYVYPSAPRIPRPIENHDTAAAGLDLAEVLASWNWLRGDVDAHLLLGWIASALFGGAIRWRPLVWVTGDAGTGKSTLQELVRHVMGGEGAILQSTDATEASVRQFLMQATIPVALDELEAEADARKALAVIKLARQAASGGVVLRGGADHKGQEFRARSSFLFSSILVPTLLDQDISRIALLELMPLARGRTPPKLEPRHWVKVGRALRTRGLAGWGRSPRTLDLYRAALAAEGHDARGADQFGTLLAFADLCLHDAEPAPERCEQWARKLSAVVISDQTDRQSDWQRMLSHLLSQPLDIWRKGEVYTVGRWILSAARLGTNPDPTAAEDALPSIGLRVHGQGPDAWLTVANQHARLAKFFEGTHWYAPAGQKGVWSQAVKRVPGAESAGTVRFDGVVSKAFRFPLRAVPGLTEGGPDAPVFTAERPLPPDATPEAFA